LIKAPAMEKFYILSLGCPRNLVDSEVLQGLLREKGAVISDEAENADVAIVNTCGFIQDAKQESIDAILQLAELKKAGKIKKLIVTGCLSQRYPKELTEEIKEIDGVFGTSDFTGIPEAAAAILAGETVREVSSDPGFLYDHTAERDLLTPAHYAYLKIQEGCSNRCSYCVIPDLKGPLRSRTVASIIREVREIRASRDIKELILIGQDTTAFGIDRTGRSELAELLREVAPAMKEGWLRLLYTHPAHFTDELIDVIEGTGNICRYIDLPVQHASDKILKDMNRRFTRGEIDDLIRRLRERIKGLVLRTSVIVGFPGETDRQFAELLDFLREKRFDRLGAFIYSKEEGTAAAGFDGQVPEEIKRDRFDEVMKLQQEISGGNNSRYLGKTMKVLIDETGAAGDPARGRTYMDAPEVDGIVYVRGEGLKAGEFVEVKITDTMEYDLAGERL